MNEKQLKERARRHHPKVPYLRHALTAFVSGGLVGVLGQGLLVMYQSVFRMQESDALTMMSVSVMGVAALATAFGWYDKLAQKCGAGLFVPICGFANSLTDSALEGKSEGLIHGIGNGMFKLAGTVITYGVVAAVIFGSLRYLLFEGGIV